MKKAYTYITVGCLRTGCLHKYWNECVPISLFILEVQIDCDLSYLKIDFTDNNDTALVFSYASIQIVTVEGALSSPALWRSSSSFNPEYYPTWS